MNRAQLGGDAFRLSARGGERLHHAYLAAGGDFQRPAHCLFPSIPVIKSMML